MALNIDNKAEYCISFIIERLKLHSENYGSTEPRPFFLGVNGMQGVGKTTLVGNGRQLSLEPLSQLVKHYAPIDVSSFPYVPLVLKGFSSSSHRHNLTSGRTG